jgi:asparagine synthase (glutamine-hydrolysing)
MERPKTGFGVPIGEWLRGPLAEWANSLLDEKKIKSQGFFNTMVLRKKWSEHLSGKQNWENQIWNILMFQVWLENNKI